MGFLNKILKLILIQILIFKDKIFKMSILTKKIKPSATLSINTKANELKKNGINVISYAVGEPDFDTPKHIKDAAIGKILEGKTKYTPTGGIIELKNEISKKFKTDNNIDYSADEIFVSAGAKLTIYEALLSLINPGDEVIIIEPYWVSYPEIVILCSGIPKFVKTDENFEIDVKEVKKAITSKTKAIIINSPSNPTGAIINERTMKEIADIAIKHNLHIISDEIYEKITYGDFKPLSIGALPEMKERTITVNGFSKSYAMTGWRLGYVGAPKDIINEMKKVEMQTVSCLPYFIQYAGVVALQSSQDCVEEMRKKFKERRNYVVQRAKEIFYCNVPDGAFYIFPNHSKYENDSIKFSGFLLEKAKVAVVPGIAFGDSGEGHIRISYATSMENLKKGFDAIEDALKKI